MSLHLSKYHIVGNDTCHSSFLLCFFFPVFFTYKLVKSLREKQRLKDEKKKIKQQRKEKENSKKIKKR